MFYLAFTNAEGIDVNATILGEVDTNLFLPSQEGKEVTYRIQETDLASAFDRIIGQLVDIMDDGRLQAALRITDVKPPRWTTPPMRPLTRMHMSPAS